jgi:hypothetical protein
MARTAAMLAALLAAWPARGAGAVRACSGGRSGRPVLRLRGGVGRHRGVQTEAAEFCKEDQVNTCPREHGRAPHPLRARDAGEAALTWASMRARARQVMLNQYAGLNFRKKELLEEIKEYEEEADGLRNAADEILMAGLDGPEEFQ